MLGAQKWHAATPVPAEKKGAFLRDVAMARSSPALPRPVSVGCSVKEHVVMEEDRTGSGSEQADSEDDIKSQSLSESKGSDEDANHSVAAESETVDGSERESGTETTDRSEVGSDRCTSLTHTHASAHTTGRDLLTYVYVRGCNA
jgi:hypothetical protein